MALQFDNSASLNRLYSPKAGSAKSSITAKQKTGLLKLVKKPAPIQHENSVDQDLAIAQIGLFLLSKESALSLVGPAGSGKTHIMRQVLAHAKQCKWHVKMSAPTHQAAARLREATGYHTETIHRIMSVSLTRNEKTGEEYLKKNGTPDILPGTVIVVDEASMLQGRLQQMTIDFADTHDCKMIFVGDSAQVNPVKEGPSITVDKKTCPWQMLELTNIHRQAAENPIIALATAIRTADPKTLPQVETNVREGKGVQYMADRRQWADCMVQQCGMDEYEHRYIAYTNRATDEAARAIRRNRYGNDAVAHPYLPGEVLTVNSRCVPNDDSGKSRRKKKRKDQVVIPSNDSVVVKSVYRDGDLYKVECDWHGHHILLDAMANYEAREKYLESLARFARQNNNWRKFFDASDSIADLRSATTMTVHSAQGSTFDNTFINLSNFAICKNAEERQRLFYVAVTRATGMIYVCGALR